MTPISVVLADDQELMRAGFRMILASEPGIEVVGEAGDGAAAVGLVERHAPDVVLMDVQMPGTDGLAATREIMAGGTSSKVVIVTTFDRDDYLFEALQAGASGFLLKNASPEDLITAVRIVARGDAMLAPELTRRLLERFAGGGATSRPDKVGNLTDRELEILRLVAGGASNAEIAAGLVVGEATVKTHVSRMLTKLGLRDRVQAVVFAYETGVVTPGGPR